MHRVYVTTDHRSPFAIGAEATCGVIFTLVIVSMLVLFLLMALLSMLFAPSALDPSPPSSPTLNPDGSSR